LVGFVGERFNSQLPIVKQLLNKDCSSRVVCADKAIPTIKVRLTPVDYASRGFLLVAVEQVERAFTFLLRLEDFSHPNLS
jgi:hypothetical protein